MGKRCPSCGACQECGHGGQPVVYPWWGVITPYQIPAWQPGASPWPSITSTPPSPTSVGSITYTAATGTNVIQ